MDPYVTGGTIRRLREQKNLTQAALADLVGVSDKAVSRWETGRGYPDITLIAPLAAALGVPATALLGDVLASAARRPGGMRRGRLYVCPVCGNVISAVGEAAVSCCGILLPPAEAEESDDGHRLTVERVEDDYYLHIDHEMTKEHYISCLAFVSSDRLQLRGGGFLYLYCNRHGLMKQRV